MPTLEIGEFSDTMVLYFGGEYSRINAYTLSATLAGITTAAKAANDIVNPGFEVEIVVEALGGGSFKTHLRAIERERKNLFSVKSARNIALSIVATVIYERVLAPKEGVTLNVGPTEVVIVAGDERVVVPRIVYDTIKQVDKSPTFRSGISSTLQSVAADSSIESFGLGTDPKKPPPIRLNRNDILSAPENRDLNDATVQILEEITELQILRAILERSRRRWEFVWNGLKIAAPVLDEAFFDDFFAHRIMIAPGDSLRVRLRLRQKRLPDLGIYVTESYEVVEVLEHLPRGGEQGVLHLKP
jgi:hypothetical protein